MPTQPDAASPVFVSGRLVGLLAFACGAAIANLYYAQPLLGLMIPSVGLPPGSASLVVTLTQVGYAIGLVLLVPLGDLVENRRLILATLGTSVVALGATALAPNAGLLFLASFVLGVSSVSVQMLIPYASHLAPPERRGQVVGTMVAGLMLGILLARPVSGFLGDLYGWRAVYRISALGLLAVVAVLALAIPSRLPSRDPRSATARP